MSSIKGANLGDFVGSCIRSLKKWLCAKQNDKKRKKKQLLKKQKTKLQLRDIQHKRMTQVTTREQLDTLSYTTIT
jgi:hypothetical protein